MSNAQSEIEKLRCTMGSSKICFEGGVNGRKQRNEVQEVKS